MGSSQKISYVNKPREFSDESDKKFNLRRQELISQLEKFVSTHELFADQNISIEFAHTGVSSFVCFIETEQKKFVFKVPLKLPPQEGDVEFLRAWESVGVSVPNILMEGNIGDHSYMLYDYIEAPLLTDAIKNKTVRSDIYVEMGKILRKMHLSKAQGYGQIVSGKPQYRTFKEWLYGEDVQKRVKMVTETGLLNENEHGSITVAQEILLDYCKDDTASTYCHFDFGTSNILATDPLTVFDPFPLLCNGIIDIGRTLQLMSSSPENIEKLKKGYFGDNSYNEKALQASILLSAYMKFYYWYRANQKTPIENNRIYLKATRYLLY